jgi:hypothetical protein
MIPSALVNDVIRPEPRGKGVAKNLSPTLPTFTLKNSSVPSLEGIFLVGRHFSLDRSGSARWSDWKRIGLTNSS